MEKSKTRKLLYEGLNHDEIELLEWYHVNPLSVYIEIALIIMADIEIITEEQRREYKARVAENAGKLRELLLKKEDGAITNKDRLKDFLFDIMNKYDGMFADISLNDETDTIFVNTVDGGRFTVTVSPVTADKALLELWAKKNPKLMSLALGVLNMRSLGAFTEEEANGYLSSILERADNSGIESLKFLSGMNETNP
ncbi:hypothetical protein VSQ32_12580 [Lachnospiraceae bacterium KK002]